MLLVERFVRVFREISLFRQSRNKYNKFNLFRLCRKNSSTCSNRQRCFDIVAGVDGARLRACETTTDVAWLVCRARRRANVSGRFLSLPDVGRQRADVARPPRHLPGHGPAAQSLLHQLVSQHLPRRQAVRRQIVGRDVPTGLAGRMQVSRRVVAQLGWHDT